MKGKEEKVKEVNPRSVRRKIKKGTNNVKEDLGKTTILKKKDVEKELKKIEKKEIKKVENKIPEHTKKLNKVPYLLFTLLSILYFATTIVLVGFTSYRTVSIIRANKNERLNTYINETLLEDSHIFVKDNIEVYNDVEPSNGKVLTYYYLVSVSMIAVTLLLAFTFSYLSELFTDKCFHNPFANNNLRILKRCILFAVFAIVIAGVSVILQRALTPFKISTIESTGVLIVALALIVSYMVVARGNEIVKE